MLKRLFSTIFAIVFTLSFSSTALAVNNKAIADNGPAIQPLYDYTSSHTTSLTISSGTAKCTASLYGYSNVTKIEITMTLQKKTLLWWSTTKTWTSTHNSTYGTLSKSLNVDSGTYRVKAVYKVYNGSNSETITSYSTEKKY